MVIPSSLKKTEKDIIKELKKENLSVYFEIRDYDAKTGAVEHNLTNITLEGKVPDRATEIINKHLEKWRKTHTGYRT